MTPLIAFALGMAPELAKGLSGDNADAVGSAVTDAIQRTVGTTDPDAAGAAIAKDPVVAATVRVALARICVGIEQEARSGELALLRVRLREVEPVLPAHAITRLAGGLTSGPCLVSVLVLATFAVVMWAAMTRSLPTGSETMINLLMGTLSTMSASVVAYWVGSSAGSAAKTDMLFRSQPAIPPASPAP